MVTMLVMLLARDLVVPTTVGADVVDLGMPGVVAGEGWQARVIGGDVS